LNTRAVFSATISPSNGWSSFLFPHQVFFSVGLQGHMHYPLPFLLLFSTTAFPSSALYFFFFPGFSFSSPPSRETHLNPCVDNDPALRFLCDFSFHYGKCYVFDPYPFRFLPQLRIGGSHLAALLQPSFQTPSNSFFPPVFQSCRLCFFPMFLHLS